MDVGYSFEKEERNQRTLRESGIVFFINLTNRKKLNFFAYFCMLEI